MAETEYLTWMDEGSVLDEGVRLVWTDLELLEGFEEIQQAWE